MTTRCCSSSSPAGPRAPKRPGERVAAGDAVIVLESMKMEIPVEAPRAGAVKEIRVQEGQTVQEGDVVAVLE
ncbi:MAG: acetyl-CoA carboxylase biotin carboxyl carrier protein subunit [Candidatus Rokuibacteriota bacterium]|nr:MAG: acetyl-CoA carboxylase biotin carboxyl carrier protein subunit [Candidatus Rokubacteria bacterium]